MKIKIKLDGLTVGLLKNHKIYSIDTEREFREFLDSNFSEVDLLGYKYGLGRVLLNTDPILFSQAEAEHFDCLSNERDSYIIEVDGYYYQKKEVEEHFEIIEE